MVLRMLNKLSITVLHSKLSFTNHICSDNKKMLKPARSNCNSRLQGQRDLCLTSSFVIHHLHDSEAVTFLHRRSNSIYFLAWMDGNVNKVWNATVACDRKVSISYILFVPATYSLSLSYIFLLLLSIPRPQQVFPTLLINMISHSFLLHQRVDLQWNSHPNVISLKHLPLGKNM